jgi:hypothetical protein
LAPWKRNAFDLDFAVQRVGIQEPQRTDQLNTSGLRCLFVLDQEQLVMANMLRTELIGWLVEVLGKLGGRVQVKTDRGGRIVADLEILQHALSKCGHGETPFACDQTTKRNPNGNDPAYLTLQIAGPPAGGLVQWPTTGKSLGNTDTLFGDGGCREKRGI